MAVNPYIIAADGRFRCINVSGGRSSAYMLTRILEANNGTLPDRTIACFANTGKEHPATLDFIRDIKLNTGCTIHWIEYRHRPQAKGGQRNPKHDYAVVDYATASRMGEPFEALIKSKKLLPNPVMRHCTANLKIAAINGFMKRGLGWNPRQAIRVLGFRADEPKRWRRAIWQECNIEFPMVQAKVCKADVLAYWQAAPFDLALAPEAGLSNCDLCFLKTRQQRQNIMRDNPELADWWIRMESLLQTKQGAPARFLKDGSYSQVLATATRPSLFDGVDTETEATDCACTD